MKKIKLTQGYKAIVDDEDYERFSKFKWFAHTDFSNGEVRTIYAERREGGKTYSMHREILSPVKGLMIDHINRDGLDNRRSNLRLITPRENALNTKLYSSNKSGFRGVRSAGKRWMAQIKVSGRMFYIGTYKDKIDAGLAYDMAALMANGRFAQTNVIKLI